MAIFNSDEIKSLASEIIDGVANANSHRVICEIPKSFTIERTVNGTTYTAKFPIRVKESGELPHIP